MPKRSGFFIASGAIGALGFVLALSGALWALFFSVGTRGGSTEEMVRYNLSDPVTAILAYGPLTLGVVGVLAAVVLVVIALTRKNDQA